MKLWFFTMKVAHFRTGEILAVETGIVKADTSEEAEEKVWEKLGSDRKCALSIDEVTDDVYSYVVYKSEIR